MTDPMPDLDHANLGLGGNPESSGRGNGTQT